MVVASRGCPQGGVLSPLLWSLVVDELLWNLNDASLYAQAYPEDIVIFCNGTRDRLPVAVARALRMIGNWCDLVGLRVNLAKAQLMILSRKRDQGIRLEIILSGVTLNYSQSIKYMGIYLDAKMSWREHITCKIRKASFALWTCRRACGGTWGITTEGGPLALLRHSQTYTNIWGHCVVSMCGKK